MAKLIEKAELFCHGNPFESEIEVKTPLYRENWNPPDVPGLRYNSKRAKLKDY